MTTCCRQNQQSSDKYENDEMATKTDNITEKLENLMINTENSNETTNRNTIVDGLDCDLPLEEVYKLALGFYKGK